jgi:hypothetical protein
MVDEAKSHLEKSTNCIIGIHEGKIDITLAGTIIFS